MTRWIPYTFVRIVLFFVAGILAGMYFPDLLAERLSYLVITVLVVLYFSIVYLRKRFSGIPNPGLIALTLVAVLGYVHVVVQTESRHPDHLINHDAQVSHYKVVITRFGEERARSWKMEGRILQVHSENWLQKKGRVVLYLSKEDYARPYRYGDVLLIKGKPQIPEGPGNPGEFDYRAYLSLKNIYHQHFLRAGAALKIGYDPPNRMLAFAFGVRKWAEATLKRFVEGDHEQAIACALVLGVTDGLDNELISAYSATGAMHVLAVSGLHVSILYLLILRILKPLNRFPGGRWGVALISLAILWIYALVTGLSPSVLRAVTMFSFLAIARPWARRANVYNTLAVSAFFLLMFDPFLIRSVGFQLSYFAVLGIVYLYPRILVLWEPEHRFTTAVWKISAVSIAAQVATFPLGLLYFHQFPNFFLLSNLVVVPLSSTVLTLGLGVLSISFFSTMASVLGYCLEKVITFLNSSIFFLEGLPFSLTEQVYITPWQCAMVILFTVILLALLQYRKFIFLVMAFAVVVVFAGLQWWRFATEVNTRMIAVYRIPGHTGVDFIDRGQTAFVADEELLRDAEKMRYHVYPHRLMAGVDRVFSELPSARSFPGARLIVWQGKTILLVTEQHGTVPDGLNVDWLIIANDALSVAQLSKVSCQRVILDSSNSFFFTSRFLEAAKLYKLDVHSVLHHGAFMSKIENQDT